MSRNLLDLGLPPLGRERGLFEERAEAQSARGFGPSCPAQGLARPRCRSNDSSTPFQFLYFASVLSRFQNPDVDKLRCEAHRQARDPMAGDLSRPDAGDYADALECSGQETEAIKRAVKEGWLPKSAVPDGEVSAHRRIFSLPGICAGPPRKLAEAMALHYRRLAERHLFKPPPQRRGGEPIVPSILSPWELGDSPKESTTPFPLSISAGSRRSFACSPSRTSSSTRSASSAGSESRSSCFVPPPCWHRCRRAARKRASGKPGRLQRLPALRRAWSGR